MDAERLDSYLGKAEGNIKVDICDLVKLFDKLAETEKEKNYIRFFEKKYLTLTALRTAEREAYEDYSKAKELAKKPEDYKIVNEFRDEYEKNRKLRKELQAEVEKENPEYYTFLRADIGKSR